MRNGMTGSSCTKPGAPNEALHRRAVVTAARATAAGNTARATLGEGAPMNAKPLDRPDNRSA